LQITAVTVRERRIVFPAVVFVEVVFVREKFAAVIVYCAGFGFDGTSDVGVYAPFLEEACGVWG
jgi:hypothetical protein